MADGIVLPPGAGRQISGAGMTLKVGSDQSARWSAFEAEVAPGFDVGAHRHADAEEIFYILEGELDLLAFEPRIRTSGDWTAWESAGGAKVTHGGPGSLMFVPAGCPHAFTNPGTARPDAVPGRAVRPRAVPGRDRGAAQPPGTAGPAGDHRPAGPLRHRAAHAHDPGPSPVTP